MPKKLETLTATELHGLPKEQTVFFLAVGPIEDFGPHLPMGLALARASKLAWLAAERLERDQPGWVGVCVPPAPLSVSANTTRSAITVRAHVLRDWLVDSCLSLARMGFVHFVCMSGNLGPRTLTAIEEAGKAVRARTRLERVFAFLRIAPRSPVLVSALSGLVDPAECRKSPLWPDPDEHGGKLDTSIALAICPELVREEWKLLPERKRDPGRLARLRARLNRQFAGYWGAPGEASASDGQHALDEMLGALMPKLRAVWSGSNPERVFRSWYSVLPPNGSFFKAWLLATMLAVLLASWVVLILKYSTAQ